MPGFPDTFEEKLTKKEANPKGIVTELSEDELIEGNKIGMHIAKRDFLLYRPVECICPKFNGYLNFLNSTSNKVERMALAELKITPGTQMVRWGYNYVKHRFNPWNSTGKSGLSYVRDNEIHTRVSRNIQINRATVVRILDRYLYDDELSNECVCYDEKEVRGGSKYTYTYERIHPKKFKKGSVVTSYGTRLEEYETLRSCELSGNLNRDEVRFWPEPW